MAARLGRHQRSDIAAGEQRRRLGYASLIGLGAGMAVWAIRPGGLARAMPESWDWPERMAARTLKLSMWDGGQRLMAVASPDAWRGITGAAALARDNRDDRRVPHRRRQGEEGDALHDRGKGGGMRMEAPELDPDALLMLLDRMLRAEAVADAPPAAERGDWLYGSAGFTEPDKHGWMAPLPSTEMWVPRALMFWRVAILSDAQVSDDQMRDPRHSLARWPAIEAAVKAYVAGSTGYHERESVR